MAAPKSKSARANTKLHFFLHFCGSLRPALAEAGRPYCDLTAIALRVGGMVSRLAQASTLRLRGARSLAGGVGAAGTLLHRALGAIAGFLYRRADLIVVVSPAFREHLMLQWKVAPEK